MHCRPSPMTTSKRSWSSCCAQWTGQSSRWAVITFWLWVNPSSCQSSLKSQSGCFWMPSLNVVTGHCFVFYNKGLDFPHLSWENMETWTQVVKICLTWGLSRIPAGVGWEKGEGFYKRTRQNVLETCLSFLLALFKRCLRLRVLWTWFSKWLYCVNSAYVRSQAVQQVVHISRNELEMDC